jgi:hypothetical protein
MQLLYMRILSGAGDFLPELYQVMGMRHAFCDLNLKRVEWRSELDAQMFDIDRLGVRMRL